MKSSHESSPTPENKNEKTPEELQKIGAKAAEAAELKPANIVKKTAGEIKDLEENFISLQDRKAKNGEKLTDEEVADWETAYRFKWKKITRTINADDELHDWHEQAQAESPMFFTKDEDTLAKTVEAQSGRFFRDRANALRDAIEASDSKNKKQHIEAIEKFEELATEHIDLKTKKAVYEDAANEDWNDYEKHRTFVHNQTIEALNNLNGLCEMYDTTPFTVRNFWPSNAVSKEHMTQAIATRMRYDRDTVEEYYAIAFGEMSDKAKEQLIENNPQMLNDEKTKADHFLHKDHFKGYWDDEEGN